MILHLSRIRRNVNRNVYIITPEKYKRYKVNATNIFVTIQNQPLSKIVQPSCSRVNKCNSHGADELAQDSTHAVDNVNPSYLGRHSDDDVL